MVRDLASNIIGGGNVNGLSGGFSGKYPDGPDTITIVATPMGNVSSATLQARISWTEAQA